MSLIYSCLPPPLLPDVTQRNYLGHYTDSTREINSFLTESLALRIDCQNMLSLQLVMKLSNQRVDAEWSDAEWKYDWQPISVQPVFNSLQSLQGGNP